MKTDVVSYNYDDKVYFVTVNGKRLGDSKGYDTADQARDAALAAVNSAKPFDDGTRSRIYKPGFSRPVRRLI